MEILTYLRRTQNARRAAGAMILLCSVSAGTILASSLTVGTDNGASAFPFGGPFYGNTGSDYQEAYAAGNFSGPIAITGIDFFLANGFTGDLYGGTYTLSLSVVSSDIGGLSSTDLSSNIGSGDTVFESVALSGAAPGMLTFTGAPFMYDPSQGNLLLDISISGGSSGGKGVAFEENEGVGTSLARYQNFGIDNGDGYGLVTQFDSSNAAAPEPGMLFLMCCGLGAMAVGRLRRRTN